MWGIVQNIYFKISTTPRSSFARRGGTSRHVKWVKFGLISAKETLFISFLDNSNNLILEIHDKSLRHFFIFFLHYATYKIAISSHE